MLDYKIKVLSEEAGRLGTNPWDPRRPQGNNLDFLRFVLAALVLYTHSFQAVHGTEGMYRLETFGRLMGGQLVGGELAVNAFFVISGFLITHSWLSRPGFLTFVWKRVLRIYPAYLVVAALCLLCFGLLAADDWRQYLSSWTNWDRYAFKVLTLQTIYLDGVLSGVPFPGAINASTWTICYEFWCYLGVPLLGVLGLLRLRLCVLALFAAYLLLYVSSIDRHYEYTTDNFRFDGLIPNPLGNYWVRLATFFLAGVVFYLFQDRIPFCRRLFLLSVGVLCVCAAAGTGLLVVLPIFGTYGLLYLAFSQRLRLTKFGRRGDLSYGLYLYAYPVQQLLVLYFGQHLNAYTLTVIAFPIASGFAWLSWRYVEAPALRLKSGRQWFTKAIPT
jgi:peptidoglycan/LPS O-acetylase OafA/YrhL